MWFTGFCKKLLSWKLEVFYSQSQVLSFTGICQKNELSLRKIFSDKSM